MNEGEIMAGLREKHPSPEWVLLPQVPEWNRRAPKGAIISDCAKYRYLLWRHWCPIKPAVNFVMLNPSTADAYTDDPTIRRCIAFAQAWGYGGIVVTNLFAFRSSSPGNLRHVSDAVGPRNDSHLQTQANQSALVMCAWGSNPSQMIPSRGWPFDGRKREAQVRAMLPAVKTHYLKLSNEGHPYHPLYLKGDLVPIKWEAP